MTDPIDDISVVIVDDQALMRGGLRMLLERADGIVVVGEADDGDAAVRLVREHRPHVVLMDIRLPNVDGIEATRRIVADPSLATRIVMLTTYDLDEYVYHAVRAGASGFLLKTTPPPQLVAAIRAVATGDTLLAPEITRRLLEEYVRRPPPGSARPRALDNLTEREVEVLRHVARGASNARDRGRRIRERGHDQDSHQQAVSQTRRARPHPRGRARIRNRAGSPGRARITRRPPTRPVDRPLPAPPRPPRRPSAHPVRVPRNADHVIMQMAGSADRTS